MTCVLPQLHPCYSPFRFVTEDLLFPTTHLFGNITLPFVNSHCHSFSLVLLLMSIPNADHFSAACCPSTISIFHWASTYLSCSTVHRHSSFLLFLVILPFANLIIDVQYSLPAFRPNFYSSISLSNLGMANSALTGSCTSSAFHYKISC